MTSQICYPEGLQSFLLATVVAVLIDHPAFPEPDINEQWLNTIIITCSLESYGKCS